MVKLLRLKFLALLFLANAVEAQSPAPLGEALASRMRTRPLGALRG